MSVQKGRTAGMARPWGALVRVGLSLLCAGVCYAAWMGAFITWAGQGGALVRAIGWLSGPVATALGFAAGLSAGERLTGGRRTPFVRLFVWPLVGCAIGAAVVYPFGPMLIVFGMFIGGYASVFLRELALRARRGRTV